MPTCSRDLAGGDGRKCCERRSACAVVHPREQRVDVDGGLHARRARDDCVADPFHHLGRLVVEHLQVGHGAMINQAD